MKQDKVLQEVRKVREEIAQRNDYDIGRIVEEIRARAARARSSRTVAKKKQASASGAA